MGSGKVSLFGRAARRDGPRPGWGAQDLADLYRVCEHLNQFGLPVVVHTGQSDEGDPWAVFERRETGEVVVHVARIDDELVIADTVRGRVHRGRDFRALADRLLADAPMVLPRDGAAGNVVLHPRMVMTAFVAAALAVSDFAGPAAAEGAAPGRGVLPPPDGPLPDEAPDRAAGREASAGLSAVQAVGIGSLAAGLAALSTQLAQGAADIAGPEPGAPPELGIGPEDGTGLFGGERPVWTVLPDASAAGPALEDALPAPQPAGAPPPQAEPPARDREEEEAVMAPQGAADDAAPPPPDARSDGPAAPRAAPATAAEGRAPATLAEGAPAPARSEAEAPEPAAALEQVSAAVTTLDQLRLPQVALAPEAAAEGAIVVHLDALPRDAAEGEWLGDGPPASATPAEAPGAAASERYMLVSELSERLHLAPEPGNVVVYMGGDVGVSGFAFGRDRIAFIEEAGAPDWLASVSIDGLDVVLIGQHGGSVTLYDAAATLV